MFHDIPDAILDRMRELEALDAADRRDGTPLRRRLRQITADTGRFLAILAASAPPGRLIEIGTSAGYSTLWLALAATATDRAVTTFELLEEKADKARDTLRRADLEAQVTLIRGDARDWLPDLGDIGFCFLDAEKEIYADCYATVVPNLVRGGLLVADNVISHRKALRPFVDRALTDERVDAVVVPVGKGELVCRRV